MESLNKMKGTPHAKVLETINARSKSEEPIKDAPMMFKGALGHLSNSITVIECKSLEEKTILASSDIYKSFEGLGLVNGTKESQGAKKE